ncbi:MAG: DHA2 family efflux MFS transporter permease subunit [Ktedonobacteraceae bacterium]
MEPTAQQVDATATPISLPLEQEDSDKNYKWRVLFSVIFGTFMFILDSTAVNVAVPTLQKVFGTGGHAATVDQVDGVLTAYILALGIVTPMAGYLSERFGIKRMYLLSLIAFVIGSLACAFAPNLAFLIAFRALQGFGGGMLGPLGIALLFGAFPDKERGLAFGVYGIPLVVAPASGPVLGGYFVQYLNWHYIFLVNIPIGIAGAILGYFWLKENKRGTSAKLDIPGIVLSTISFGTLLYAIQRGSSDGWTSPRIVTLLSIGVVALLGLIAVELYVKDPLLDLRLFVRRTYAFANIVGWVSSIALFGAEFLLPIYLQTLRGQSPLQAGLLVLPLAISAGIVTPLAGALYNRIGGRWLIFIGCVLLAINTWFLAHISVDTPFIDIMGIVAIRGVALGLSLQTTLTIALNGLEPRQLPRASSLLNATRNVFQSFGVAALGTVVTNQLATYTTQTASNLKNPATSLGQQLIQTAQTIAQGLQQQGLPASVAQQAAFGKAIGQIMAHQFPLNFTQSINDAYFVTFWLAIAAAALALTLPGRPHQTKIAAQQAAAPTVSVQPQA